MSELIKKRGHRKLAIAAAVAAAFCRQTGVVRATTTDWQLNTASGNWSNASNWNNGEPGTGYDVEITHADSVNRIIAYDVSGSSPMLNSLLISNFSAAGTDTLNQSANTLSVASESIDIGGIYSLSGGTNQISSILTMGISGTNGNEVYNLSGSGSLNTNSATAESDEYIGYGATAIFNQTGGTNTVGNTSSYNSVFSIGTTSEAAGIYNLNGSNAIVNVYGSAYVGGQDTYQGGAGVLNISNGTMNVTGQFAVFNTSGTAVNFTGGTLTVGSVNSSTGAASLFQWTGGTLNVTGFGGLSVDGAANSAFGSALALATGQQLNISGGTFAIGDSSGNGSLNLSNGNISGGTEFVGSGGGTGVFNQSAGTNTINILTVGISGGNGSYQQSGGTVNTPSLNVGYSATNGLSIGTYTLDGPGVVNVSGGVENVGVGGFGLFNQSDGTNTTKELFIGIGSNNPGVYLLSSAGVLNVTDVLFVGSDGNGVFNQSGGTLNAATVYVADGVNGSYQQSGGTVNTPFLAIGHQSYGTGSYALNGPGTLNTSGGSETVGDGGTGLFNQSAGTNTTATLTIGQESDQFNNSAYYGSGTYLLSGNGALNVLGNLYVGTGGNNTGVFNQSGGAAMISGSMVVNNTVGNAVYLSGGTMTVGSMNLSGSSTRFNWTGGTLQLTGGNSSFGALAVPKNGTLTGTGIITGNVTSDGTIAPLSSSTATLNISSGNYTQNNDATLLIRLGGTTQGLQYDFLEGTGTATLNGAITFSITNNFTPASGESFQILEFPSIAVQFPTIQIQQLPGFNWDTSKLDSNGTITLVAYLVNNTSYTAPAGTSNYSSISGTGTTTINGNSSVSTGSLDQNGLAMTNGGALALTSSNTNSSVTTLSVSGSPTISGSAPNGSAIQTNPASLTVTGAASVGNVNINDGLVLNLAGNTTDTASNIAGTNNTVVNIPTGASFIDSTGNTTYVSTMTNVSGTMTASSPNSSIILFYPGTQNGVFNTSNGGSITASGNFGPSSIINDSANFTINGGIALPGDPSGTAFHGTLNVSSGANFTLGGGTINFPDQNLNFQPGSTLISNSNSTATFTSSQVLSIPNAVFTTGLVTFTNAGLSFGSLTIGSLTDNTTPGQYFLEAGQTIAIGTLNVAGANQLLSTGADMGYNTTLSIGTFNFSGGTIRGYFNVTGIMNWTGGVIDGAAVGSTSYGIVTILPGATLNSTTGGNMVTRGGILNNEGSIASDGMDVGSDSSSNPASRLGLANNSAADTNGALHFGAEGATNVVSTLDLISGSTTVITGTLNVGNDGSTTTGSGYGVVNAYGTSALTTDTIQQGSTAGGEGDLNIYQQAVVTVRSGMLVNNVTLADGTLTVENLTPTDGQDPELNSSAVGGYLLNGTLNVLAGTFTAPKVKLGITSGFTGTYNQTGGTAFITSTLGVGNDANLSNGSGMGIVSISGGVTNTAALLVGSTNGGTGTVTVSGKGVLNVSAGVTVLPGSMLTISTGGTVILLPGDGTNSVAALNLSGGKLDISSNLLDLPGGNLAKLTALVKAGYANGIWSGNGITSSTASSDSRHLTALGVIQSGSDVLIKYTYYGDTNLDGIVDGTDYSRIDAAYLADQTHSGEYTGWYNGDFNYDGVIDGSDYTLMDNAFNRQVTLSTAELALPTAQITDGSAVPEPGSFALLGLSGAVLLGRRAKRSRSR